VIGLARVLVIGAGNEIMGNDGIGLAVIERINKLKLSPQVKTMVMGTDCWSVLNEAVQYELIFIVDAVSTGGKEGEVYFFPAQELDPTPRPYSLHDFTWVDLFRLTGLLKRTFVFGVETNTLNLGTEISPYLWKKMDDFAAKLYKILTLAAGPTGKNALEFSRVFREGQINMEGYSGHKNPGNEIMNHSDFI